MSIHRSISHRSLRHLGLGAIVAITIGLTAACQQEAQVGASPSADNRPATSSAPAATTSGGSTSPGESSTPTGSASASSPASQATQRPGRTARPTTARPAPATSKPSSSKPTQTRPSATTSARGFGPVTSANLPSSNLIFGGVGAESETSTGWESRTSYCKIQQPAGAQHIQHRKFPSAGGESSAADVFVMDFPTVKQASAAVAAMAASYAHCTDGTDATYEGVLLELTTPPQASPTGPVTGVAHRIFPRDRHTGFTTSGLVIQVGARVMWVELVDFGISECAVTTGSEDEVCEFYANANAFALRLAA